MTIKKEVRVLSLKTQENKVLTDFIEFREKYKNSAKYLAGLNQTYCTIAEDHRAEEALEDVFMNSLPKYDRANGNLSPFVSTCLRNNLSTVKGYDKDRAPRKKKNDDKDEVGSAIIATTGKRNRYIDDIDYLGYDRCGTDDDDCSEDDLRNMDYDGEEFEQDGHVDSDTAKYHDAEGCLLTSFNSAYSLLSEVDQITLCGTNSKGKKLSRKEIGKLRGGISPSNVGYQKHELTETFSMIWREEFLSIYKGKDGEKIFANFLNRYAKGKTVVKNKKLMP